jgi:DNA-binding CsgD family transcriptional regulator
MFFITRLDSIDNVIPDFYKLIISILVKFRPLLISIMFRIVFSIVENVIMKKRSLQNEETDKLTEFDYSLLSRREKEVARLAAKGYTNAQISEKLFISTETVKSHMNAIFEKFKITSRKELGFFNLNTSISLIDFIVPVFPANSK